MAGLDGQKNRLSRRGFLGLAAGAAAAAALPGSVLGLGAPAEDGDAPALVVGPNERFNAAMALLDDYYERIGCGMMLYGLQYGALTVSVGNHCGIDRSAS